MGESGRIQGTRSHSSLGQNGEGPPRRTALRDEVVAGARGGRATQSRPRLRNERKMFTIDTKMPVAIQITSACVAWRRR